MSGESGYLDEAETIRDWFVAEWDSTVAIDIYENQKFTKPTDAHWARLTIRSQEGRPASIGGPNIRYRHDGNILLEVFAPEGVGDGRARELIDEGKINLKINMTLVPYIDSAGLGCLINVRSHCKARGGSLTVTDLNSDMEDIFKKTRMDVILGTKFD